MKATAFLIASSTCWSVTSGGLYTGLAAGLVDGAVWALAIGASTVDTPSATVSRDFNRMYILVVDHSAGFVAGAAAGVSGVTALSEFGCVAGLASALAASAFAAAGFVVEGFVLGADVGATGF